MRIKSYFANTIEGAMTQARQELGPDGMLMNSRNAMPEARHLGEYEVVFASAEASEAALAGDARGRPGADHSIATDGLSKEISELRGQLEQMAANLNRARAVGSSNMLSTPALAGVFASLIGMEVNPELAHTIVGAVRGRGDVVNEEQVRQRLREEIESMCPIDATLGRKLANATGARRVVALIGPSGCGKTTTLVKLAVRYGIAAKRPTQLLTMDLDRIGAADQLHSFASILGVGFQTIETGNALRLALHEHKNKDLILIDTPGYGPKEIENTSGEVEFLSRHAEIDVHLVLPASMKPADLASVVDRFAGFRPHKLIFTRLDETRTFGPLLNEAVRTGKPISFLTAGQQIPEDLESATRGRIAGLLMGEIETAAGAAAA